MNVQAIIRCWIKRNGFHGLVNYGRECACKVENLAEHCLGLELGCEPGHKTEGCPTWCGMDHDFHIDAPIRGKE